MFHIPKQIILHYIGWKYKNELQIDASVFDLLPLGYPEY